MPFSVERRSSFGWRIETRCATRDPYLLKLW
jgi:hypothetical protein